VVWAELDQRLSPGLDDDKRPLPLQQRKHVNDLQNIAELAQGRSEGNDSIHEVD
jgi:hypothetical protein